MNGTDANRAVITSNTMEVDYLIVGTGPAGAALAAFMASYGESVTKSQQLSCQLLNQ